MPHSATLRIEADRVTLGEVSHRPQPPGTQWGTRLSGAELLEFGRVLGERYLSGEAGDELARELDSAVRQGSSLRLGLDVDDELTATLWETLTLPGHDVPLALHPAVELYRFVAGTVAEPRLPGPLRILAVIGCPEQSGADLLDYEYELSRIQDAVENARHGGKAEVRILNWGTRAAIREALRADRYHVLHISCHATPGILVLETEDGQADYVTASDLATQMLPPLVVLAGCSTALARPDGLPGLAQALLRQGVSAVLAMTAPVSDIYATDLSAAFYAELAANPEPLAALAQARRGLEQDSRLGGPPVFNTTGRHRQEWATAALFLSGDPQALFEETTERVPTEAHRVGDFVGRRAELRHLLRAIRDGVSRILLHGIGGVGKSTLARQLVQGRHLAVAGAVTVDQIMLALADLLDDGRLRDGGTPWQARLEQVTEPVTIVLDDFEDNLPGNTLADLLEAWPGLVIVTSRRPFQVTESWVSHHLGPLSQAEARKLMWRLPALDALPVADRRRAAADIGGHPRSLEYLDALLRSGEARFPEVATRIEGLLRDKGIADPASWLADVSADRLDRQLAETVTLTADDVLLGDLLGTVEKIPLARRLLIGASVYRLPVDDIGLAALVSDELTDSDDERRELATTELRRVLDVARSTGGPQSPYAPVYIGMLQQLYTVAHRDSHVIPAEFGPAMAALIDLGLLVPIQAANREVRFQVHRWTARATAELASAEELVAAHEKAARNYAFQALYLSAALVFSQMNLTRVTQELEAVHHFVHAGQWEQAEVLLDNACGRLQSWGFWDWERHVYEETLAAIGTTTPWSEKLLYWLGNNAYEVGDYANAEARYEQLLANAEQRGDSKAIANGHHELGMIAYRRGDYHAAETRLRQALAAGMENVAATYNMLGIVAHDRQSYDEAERWYRMALAISRRRKDRAGLGAAFGQLGALARAQGDFEKARAWQEKSMDLKGRLGDAQGQARSLGELGAIAALTGEHADAADYYQRSMEIFDRMGDRHGVLLTYGSLGDLAAAMGDRATAEHWYQKTLDLAFELGDLRSAATTFRVLAEQAGPAEPEDWVAYTLRSFFLNMRMQLPQSGDDAVLLAYQRRELSAVFRDVVEQVVEPATAIQLNELLDGVPLAD
jgi:tetratricopeptide (TPR) repeat protein